MTTTYKPSEQQQAVLDWATNGTGHLNLVARAGCGKTSTLKLLVALLVRLGLTASKGPGRGGAFLGSYNKAIATEISEALTAAGIAWNLAQAGTMHSLGKRAWKKIAPAACEEPDAKKVDKLFDAMYPVHPTNDQIREYRTFVIKAVGLAKQRAFGVTCDIDNRAAWFDMVDHFGLEEELEENQNASIGIEAAIRIYRRSLQTCREVIDFDDMILAPLYFKARFWKFEWIMIDEAQDTNPARRALALACLAPGGRLIAVGDPAQAIYGFTGADSDSMDLIKAALSSQELPLNRTYRCPKSVVALAQTWVPDIQATDAAPEGTVRTITQDDFRKEAFGTTDAILCRNSAPLVDLAYSLIRRGIACRVEGRKIGEGLLKLANRFRVKTLMALQSKLSSYLEKETAKWMAKGKEQKAADIADAVETLQTIIDQLLSERKTLVADLAGFVDRIFGDTPEGAPQQMLTLCTVHKSKGREWDRVYLLGRNLYMPSKWARKDWQLDQEDNLCYVAVTRAKQELVEVIVEKEDQRKERAA